MITSFTGNSKHKLDSKNRVCVPADYRKWPSDGQKCEFKITKGLGDHLTLYPMPEWNVIIEDLYKKLSPLKVKHQNYLRTFTSDAETVQCDKNGRITIPKYLRKFANIDKNVTFIGMVNKIEIWNSETYANHRPSHLSPGDKYYDDIKE